MACYLKANKTKMVKLLQDKGYKPTIKRARFRKLSRGRSCQFTWHENDGVYGAILSSIGEPYLKILPSNQTAFVTIPITLAELEKYDMKEEINK